MKCERLRARLLAAAVLVGLFGSQCAPPDQTSTAGKAAPPNHGSETAMRLAEGQSADRPNVVLIYVDDLGYGDLGSFGHHTIETPHLDRLAAEGMRFTSYYAPSPLCSPSRAALLTGRTPFRSGIENWIPEDQDVELGRSEVTIPELLREQGYATFLGGKWHLNGGLDNRAHAQPQDHGFDEWIALHAFALPNTRNPTNLFENGQALGGVEGFAAGITLDRTLRWLENHRSHSPERPFFVYLATAEPHSMIASPDEYYARYSELTRGVPEPFVNGNRGESKLEARGPGEYYANITYLDAQIGRLLTYLDDNGLSESTFVFFASDNGPVTTDWRHWWEVNLYGSTGGLRGRKADLYDGGIRVPAIVRWPGATKAGSESNAVIGGYDLLPTLAAVVGFDVPDDRVVDGEDFSPLLRGEPWRRERPLYFEFDDDQGFHFALRGEHFKLLADATLERLALYDMRSDPFEVINVAEQEIPILESMLGELRAMRTSVREDPLRPASTVARPGFRGN